MSRRDDNTLLRDMLDCARLAATAAAGRRRTDLDSDPVFRAALERFIEIIGEAAGRIGAQRRTRMADVPWPDIVGMRNRLVHGYAQIDHDILWRVIHDDLPRLIVLLERELRE